MHITERQNTHSMLKLQPLTSEAFAPYGDVLEVSDHRQHFPINRGNTERYHALARVDVTGQEGYPIISIFRTQPVVLPFRIECMERHPLGSQSFTMLGGEPYLVVVAEPGEFRPQTLRGFLAQPHQGVNYHRGTWHHYCLCLNRACDFLVVDRGGCGHNCDEILLPAEQQRLLMLDATDSNDLATDLAQTSCTELED
ncbi:ureidoglycolate lyase [Microbulbifer bruguierae]|uniref:Ureidoglycolate lyase n=1 Tax=Microbulbifer bruguierae TaxID=3029061 RepID=A0ABY8N9R4_9GAMM|nr:ureidoglycolate lyase [Microbulbifer bruguierae]WGL15169.1 ureidoglycolate lyase [Microbulbifer bruguierae]